LRAPGKQDGHGLTAADLVDLTEAVALDSIDGNHCGRVVALGAWRISRPNVAEGVLKGPATPMRISWPERAPAEAASGAEESAAAKIAENVRMLTVQFMFNG
jgi:hypothetical protein